MATSDSLQRPGFITFLAVLHFVGTASWALVAVGCLIAAANAGADVRYLLTIGAAACGILAGLQLACGIGLWALKPFGRILQIVLAVPFLLNIPFGTAISILLIIYLNKPGIKLMFSGRPASAFSPEEQRLVSADGGLPGVAVALIVLIGLGPVMALVVVPIVAAIAVPGFLRARMTANEHSAIASIRTTVSAQVLYSASCGNGGFATNYLVLGTPVTGGAPFISGELGYSAAPQKDGYNFSLQPGAGSQPGPMDCMGRPTVTSFYATAVPQTFRSSGIRAFAASDRGEVWQNDETPPAEPFGPPSTRVR
jgi:hypothetical protein